MLLDSQEENYASYFLDPSNHNATPQPEEPVQEGEEESEEEKEGMDEEVGEEEEGEG